MIVVTCLLVIVLSRVNNVLMVPCLSVWLAIRPVTFIVLGHIAALASSLDVACCYNCVDVVWSVCVGARVCVSCLLLVIICKMVEPIEVPFRMSTNGGPRNHV